MPSVGLKLKQARERLGLSAEHVAERTKVPLYKIEALENGNFERLPDDIYLDGIVRAYAREVAIDAAPLMPQVRAERAKFDEDTDTSFDDLDALFDKAPVTTREGPPTHNRLRELFPSESLPDLAPAEDDFLVFDSTQANERQTGLAAQIETAAARAGLRPRGPRNRFSGVALPLLALLAVTGWGAYLYELTRGTRGDETRVDSSPSSARPSEVASGNAVSPSDSVPAAKADVSTPLNTTPGAALPDSLGTSGTSMRPSTPVETVPTIAPAHDLSGNWTLATRVESSSYPDFTDLNLGYEIQLEQAGNRVTGSGRKVTENGAAIRSEVQTPISLEGTIAGDRLTLTFTERGAQRHTQGKLVMLIDESGTLRGRFSSTAAQSSGTVEAHRVGTP